MGDRVAPEGVNRTHRQIEHCVLIYNWVMVHEVEISVFLQLKWLQDTIGFEAYMLLYFD